MLDVVVIHIRQHREVGTVEAQVLKRLACFRHIMRTLAVLCAAISQAGNTRAHNEARIRTSRFQDVRDHRGGRCLAVRAGYTNLRLFRAEQGEAFRTSQDPQTALSRFNQFRVLRRNRIAHHRHLRCADVTGVVFRKNLDAERGEMLQLRRLLQIAPLTCRCRLTRYSATALMPLPPMPTMWMRAGNARSLRRHLNTAQIFRQAVRHPSRAAP